MRIPANSVSEYISKLPEDRRESFERILEILRNNLPEGFQECLGYGMPAFAVPHSLYPDGYHCKPEEPLPFISVGNQKNFIGFYHMGVYAMPEIYDWFVGEYPKHSKTDMCDCEIVQNSGALHQNQQGIVPLSANAFCGHYHFYTPCLKSRIQQGQDKLNKAANRTKA